MGGRGAMYARAASRSQESLEQQFMACREYAKQNGIAIATDHAFADEGRSGLSDECPGFSVLLRAAQNRQFDILLVVEASRLSRDTGRLLAVVAEFDRCGVRIVMVHDELERLRKGSS